MPVPHAPAQSWLLTAFFVCFAAAPLAAQSPDLAALLARPISPGSIAALASHSGEPKAQLRVAEALKDPRANVRAVAARVSFTAGMRGLIPALRLALQTEQDPTAAAEMVRLVVQLGTADAYHEALAAARAKPEVAAAFIGTLARAMRSELASDLPTFLELDPEASALAAPALAVTATNPDARAKVLDLFARNPTTLRRALRALRARSETAPDDLLDAWLHSGLADVRTVALWHVVSVASSSKDASSGGVPPAVRPVVEELRTRLADAVTWEVLAVEVLARASGQPPRARKWQALAADDADTRLRENVASDAHSLLAQTLDQTELEDVSEALFGERDRLRKRAENRDTPAPAEPASGFRSAPPFTAGLWSDLMDVHGCKASTAQLVLGDVNYRPDGRVNRILLAQAGTAPCRAAATELFMLTLYRENGPAPADVLETLLAYFDPDVVTCVDEAPGPFIAGGEGPPPAGGAGSMGSAGKKVQPPKKIRNRDPIYPPSEQKAGLQGVVVLDARLSTSGCVRSVRVVRSVSPDLDMAAMVAVLGWKYAPTVVEGKPMPVVMTTSVNFSLRP
jgi:TonB family protein